MPNFDSTSAYTPGFLKFYDLYILSFSNRFAWRCSKSKLLELYNRNATGKHLEVGVGSGYFLDHCRFPVAHPQITLFDLNQECLNYCAARISRYQPKTILGDALQPFPQDLGPFQSIALNYVLHCIQGDLKIKSKIFDNIKAVLAPGGILFGATILNVGVQQNFLARKLISIYNQQGIFGNINDSLEDLTTELQQRFKNVSVTVSGSVALFTASDR